MNKLFSLHLKLPGGQCTLTAFDDGHDDRGAQKYRLAVKDRGAVIFPVTGPLWGCFAPCDRSVSSGAKRSVLEHAAMKPGDTDSEFFADYTPLQIAWVERYSDFLTDEAMIRFGEDA